MGRLLVLLGAVVVIGGAAPAFASPDDAFDDTGFLATVRDAGLTYSNPDQAIAFGKAVCGWIGSGESGPELVRTLQNENPGLSTDHATLFVAIAAKYYCPQQLTAPH
ncbi:DUF732 domain-containing protein [Mycobacterium sp. THU-M104]|uniref:DUF732 domain-containing protein n=1 Tax=Mycobacterium sp. THU-M104 TaxID=3410515 RepID=UPI003B9D1712